MHNIMRIITTIENIMINFFAKIQNHNFIARHYYYIELELHCHTSNWNIICNYRLYVFLFSVKLQTWWR